MLASRASRTIETADAVASALGTELSESTCDLCEMHPGEAEGLTEEEMRVIHTAHAACGDSTAITTPPISNS